MQEQKLGVIITVPFSISKNESKKANGRTLSRESTIALNEA
jgi:hypothetical protein